ncbi:hypothetical protein LTR94_032823, partial [Friedmanniomyces endolithicus]
MSKKFDGWMPRLKKANTPGALPFYQQIANAIADDITTGRLMPEQRLPAQRRLAAGLGIELPKKAPAAKTPIDMKPSDALSIHKNMKATLEGRAVGILIADGTDAAEFSTVMTAVKKAKGKAVVVAPKVGGAKLSDGTVQKADGQLAGSPSQIFDAVAIVLSEE